MPKKPKKENVQCDSCGNWYSTRNSLLAHCSVSKDCVSPKRQPSPFKIGEGAQKRACERRKKARAAATAKKQEKAKKCCGEVLPTSLTSWRRHKKKHDTCPRANAFINLFIEANKKIAEQADHLFAQCVLGKEPGDESLPEPGTGASACFVERAWCAVKNPVAHDMVYRRHEKVLGGEVDVVKGLKEYKVC